MTWANKVYRESIQKKDSALLAEAYYLYGKIYQAAGDVLTAKRFFMRALRIQEKQGVSEELARLYYRLADLAFRQLLYKEARYYIDLEFRIARQLGTDKALIRVYGDLDHLHRTDWSPASLHYPKPNIDSALYYIRKMEPLLLRSKDPVVLTEFYRSTGDRFLEARNTKCLSYYYKTLWFHQKHKKRYEEVNSMLRISQAYISFRQFKKGLAWLRKAEIIQSELPSNTRNFTALKNSFALIYHAYYRGTGNWQKAYQYQQLLFGIVKQELAFDRNGALSRLSLEYDTEKKEARIKQQQQEIAFRNESLRNHQRFIMAMSALLMITIGMSVVFFRLYRKNQRISQRNADLVKEQNHRVKNNLQVVSSLLSLQSNRLTDTNAQRAVEESQLRVHTMAILHRRLYDSDGLVTVNLAEYLPDLVRGVINSYGYNQIEPALDIPSVYLTADQTLPVGLIINELTTNACKYAFADNPDPSFRLEVRQHGRQLTLQVTDNGPGWKQFPDHSRVRSFGLRLISLQVSQLRGTYFFADNTPHGTAFTMTFSIT
ncbi:histidine kinase dimerization/phosphoacceptor domain -containing protein [Arsenicibacter rosenii]|uniref:histidine kinase n=1 Tax=Arsenicibacter rosenii TaxID=1750698 RepID=A0A1S2VF20_9BACT|nr:histidine kinase dimerization/phosphoacceptor domain -containing protein [Arsenicibacter rosenii]OIN57351.1 hypothetical protein BLX24_20460 [Arsenicibacter rosenii]